MRHLGNRNSNNSSSSSSKAVWRLLLATVVGAARLHVTLASPTANTLSVAEALEQWQSTSEWATSPAGLKWFGVPSGHQAACSIPVVDVRAVGARAAADAFAAHLGRSAVVVRGALNRSAAWPTAAVAQFVQALAAAPLPTVATTHDPKFGVGVTRLADHVAASTFPRGSDTAQAHADLRDQPSAEVSTAFFKARTLHDAGVPIAGTVKQAFGLTQLPSVLAAACGATAHVDTDGAVPTAGGQCDVDVIGIGGSGRGLPMHWHGEVVANMQLAGAKWWAVAPTAPPCGYNTQATSLHWFRHLLPTTSGDEVQDCLLLPGDFIHVPEAWHHATVNVGPSVNVVYARRDNGGASPPAVPSATPSFYQYTDTTSWGLEDQLRHLIAGATAFPHIPELRYNVAARVWAAMNDDGAFDRSAAALALSHVQAAVQHNPLSCASQLLLSKLLASAGQAALAMAPVDAAVRHCPFSVAVCRHKAALLYRSGRPEAANTVAAACLRVAAGVIRRQANTDVVADATHHAAALVAMAAPDVDAAQATRQATFTRLAAAFRGSM